jgi:DNA binding domain, excisionase family
MTEPLSQDLLTGADAAAAYTGLTRRVIYHLVESGALPVKRIGRRLYFRRSELDRFFSQRLAAP